jgi:hypothetical protein
MSVSGVYAKSWPGRDSDGAVRNGQRRDSAMVPAMAGASREPMRQRVAQVQAWAWAWARARDRGAVSIGRVAGLSVRLKFIELSAGAPRAFFIRPSSELSADIRLNISGELSLSK